MIAHPLASGIRKAGTGTISAFSTVQSERLPTLRADGFKVGFSPYHSFMGVPPCGTALGRAEAFLLTLGYLLNRSSALWAYSRQQIIFYRVPTAE